METKKGAAMAPQKADVHQGPDTQMTITMYLSEHAIVRPHSQIKF